MGKEQRQAKGFQTGAAATDGGSEIQGAVVLGGFCDDGGLRNQWFCNLTIYNSPLFYQKWVNVIS